MRANHKKANLPLLFLLFLLAASISAAAQDYTGRSVSGEQHARQQVTTAIREVPVEPFSKPLLPTKEVAVAVAEPVLFQAYGRKQVLSERPYEAYLIDGYWYVTGTLPQRSKGGTFEIILAASDGRVVHLTHYK